MNPFGDHSPRAVHGPGGPKTGTGHGPCLLELPVWVESQLWQSDCPSCNGRPGLGVTLLQMRTPPSGRAPLLALIPLLLPLYLLQASCLPRPPGVPRPTSGVCFPQGDRHRSDSGVGIPFPSVPCCLTCTCSQAFLSLSFLIYENDSQHHKPFPCARLGFDLFGPPSTNGLGFTDKKVRPREGATRPQGQEPS